MCKSFRYGQRNDTKQYRNLSGYHLSFTNIKEISYEMTRKLSNIYGLLCRLCFLLDSNLLCEKDNAYFKKILVDMADSDAE